MGSRLTTPSGFLRKQEPENPIAAAQEVGANMFRPLEDGENLSLEGYKLDEPCSDWYLAQYIPAGMSPGGVDIPETAFNETPKQLIVAAGPGKLIEGRQQMKAKPGDVVRFWGHFLEYDRRKRLVWMRDEFIVQLLT